MLTLRYRRPTPLRADLRFEAWVEDVTDDRVTSRGRALHDGVVTVEAEGRFKILGRDRVMRLAEPR
jgi:acyl-CoA thioesterase FadM